MCVIAKGARKDFRAYEFRQCMKTNGYGFFVAVLRKKPADNTFVRTLDEEEAFKAYELAGPDDTVVLHARIPSRGGREKNLADVHGWVSEEGIRFCHNGTIVSLDEAQKAEGCAKMTDSEYFFRRIFLPLYRAEGSKWTELVDRIVKVLCAENRFLFIFPDNTVKTVGRFVEDHGCIFSNCSYKVPTPVAPRVRFETASSFYTVPTASAARTLPGFVEDDLPGRGQALLEAVGASRIIRLATLSLATTSLTARASQAAVSDNCIVVVKELATDMFRGLPYPLGPTMDFGSDLTEIFADAGDRTAKDSVKYAVDALIDLFGESLVAKAVPDPADQALVRGVEILETKVKAILRNMHNAIIDVTADNPQTFIRSYGLTGVRIPRPTMRSQQFVYGGVADATLGDTVCRSFIVPGVRALLQEAARAARAAKAGLKKEEGVA